MQRRVLAVVVTFNSEGVLEACLDSLGSELHPEVEITVVVVDNASIDRTIEVANAHPVGPEVIALPSNRGYAAAINAAVEAIGSEGAILVLNDDTRVSPGSIRTLLESLEQVGTGITVPRLVDGDGVLLKSLRREPSIGRVFGESLLGGDRAGRFPPLGEVVQDEEAYSSDAVTPWASGCAWLISRVCWNAVGRWDESLFLYGEDADYALRTADAGLVMRFVPAATVVHLVGPSHDDPRLWTMSVWNRYRVYRRRHSAFAAVLFRLGLILNEGLRALAGRKVHRAAFAALVDPRKLPEEVR